MGRIVFSEEQLRKMEAGCEDPEMLRVIRKVRENNQKEAQKLKKLGGSKPKSKSELKEESELKGRGSGLVRWGSAKQNRVKKTRATMGHKRKNARKNVPKQCELPRCRRRRRVSIGRVEDRRASYVRKEILANAFFSGAVTSSSRRNSTTTRSDGCGRRKSAEWNDAVALQFNRELRQMNNEREFSDR